MEKQNLFLNIVQAMTGGSNVNNFRMVIDNYDGKGNATSSRDIPNIYEVFDRSCIPVAENDLFREFEEGSSMHIHLDNNIFSDNIVYEDMEIFQDMTTITVNCLVDDTYRDSSCMEVGFQYQLIMIFDLDEITEFGAMTSAQFREKIDELTGLE